jgi:prepilin-type N-terminal cleavage/methylation domain-containing protein
MRSNEHGFTLVEVLVATVVIAVVILSIASAGVHTIKADTSGSRVSVATALGEAKLEQLRNLRRTNAMWTEGTHTETGVNEDGTIGQGKYTRVWVVDLDYNNFKNLSRVTVTVSWNDGTSGTGSVTLASLF